jgi:hypothetical protein
MPDAICSASAASSFAGFLKPVDLAEWLFGETL